MSGRGQADVVFCLDASASMRPCIAAVKQHVRDFVSGLGANGQGAWDLRFDYIAHSAGHDRGSVVYRHESVFHADVVQALYGGQARGTRDDRFFTSSAEELCRAMERVTDFGDEAALVALDTCLDLPWRDASACHRVVIMLTDEALETGVAVAEQTSKLDALVAKIRDLRVMLFLVAPESPGFLELATVERSEYQATDIAGDGLRSVDMSLILAAIGKSVSASRTQSPARPDVRRGLFGQTSWGVGGTITAADARR